MAKHTFFYLCELNTFTNFYGPSNGSSQLQKISIQTTTKVPLVFLEKNSFLGKQDGVQNDFKIAVKTSLATGFCFNGCKIKMNEINVYWSKISLKKYQTVPMT